MSVDVCACVLASVCVWGGGMCVSGGGGMCVCACVRACMRVCVWSVYAVNMHHNNYYCCWLCIIINI